MNCFKRIAVAMLATVAMASMNGVAAARGTHPVQVNVAATQMQALDPSIRINTAGGARTARCTSITAQLAIDGTGGVTVAPNGAVFVGCGLNGVGATVTQTEEWVGTLRHLHDATNVTAFTLFLIIVDDGIQVSAGACSFDLVGSLLGDRFLQPTIPHRQLVNLPTMKLPPSLELTALPLLVANATFGCAAVGIANNQLATLDDVFVFNPVLVVAGL